MNTILDLTPGYHIALIPEGDSIVVAIVADSNLQTVVRFLITPVLSAP